MIWKCWIGMSYQHSKTTYYSLHVINSANSKHNSDSSNIYLSSDRVINLQTQLKKLAACFFRTEARNYHSTRSLFSACTWNCWVFKLNRSLPKVPSHWITWALLKHNFKQSHSRMRLLDTSGQRVSSNQFWNLYWTCWLSKSTSTKASSYRKDKKVFFMKIFKIFTNSISDNLVKKAQVSKWT